MDELLEVMDLWPTDDFFLVELLIPRLAVLPMLPLL